MGLSGLATLRFVGEILNFIHNLSLTQQMLHLLQKMRIIQFGISLGFSNTPTQLHSIATMQVKKHICRSITT